MCRFFGLFLLIVICPVAIIAETFYVSNTGNNSNSGLSLAEAFSTLQYGVDQLNPGDTLMIENGNYEGFALYSGGVFSLPVYILAIGSNAIINLPCPTSDGINIENANYVILDGLTVINQPRNGIRLANANQCVVRNCICDNNYERGIFTAFTDDLLIENNICSNSIDEHGIYVSNSSDRITIRNNECFENNNIGIHLNGDVSQGGDGIISDVWIYGNYIHDNQQAAGINMDGVENAIIYNNIIVNNHSSQGIAMFQADGAIMSHAARIYNNTIVVPSDGRWGILMKQGAEVDTEIFNNIIINLHTWRGSIACESIGNLKSNYNVLVDRLSNVGDGSYIALTSWQSLGLDLASYISGPVNSLFRNYSNDDFQILRESIANDSGNYSLVSNYVLDDFLKASRPIGDEVDIGAFELKPSPLGQSYSLFQNSITMIPFDQHGIINLSGEFDGYIIELLNQQGNTIEDLSNENSPISLDIDLLDENIHLLRIKHITKPWLSFQNLIK